MIFNLPLKKVRQIVDFLVVVNVVLLAIDLALVYLVSRNVERIYNEVGLLGIYGSGVYFFGLRVAFVVIVTVAAKVKFWGVVKEEVSRVEGIFLKTAFWLLVGGTLAALETLIETILIIF